jgi:hypothetical protein
MELVNGAKVVWAFTTTYNNGTTYGLVMAEKETEYVTWNVYLSHIHADLWESENGHYFMKLDDAGAARQKAEIDFGERLVNIMSMNIFRGLEERVNG